MSDEVVKTFCIDEEFSHYNWGTRKVYLRADADLYALFHEYAHADQHQSHWIWERLFRIKWVPVIGYLVNLLIEFDADRRARKRMKALGLWSEEAKHSAKENLRAYAMNVPEAKRARRRWL